MSYLGGDIVGLLPSPALRNLTFAVAVKNAQKAFFKANIKAFYLIQFYWIYLRSSKYFARDFEF